MKKNDKKIAKKSIFFTQILLLQKKKNTPDNRNPHEKYLFIGKKKLHMPASRYKQKIPINIFSSFSEQTEKGILHNFPNTAPQPTNATAMVMNNMKIFRTRRGEKNILDPFHVYSK